MTVTRHPQLVQGAVAAWTPSRQDEPNGWHKRTTHPARRAPHRDEQPVRNRPRCVHGCRTISCPDTDRSSVPAKETHMAALTADEFNARYPVGTPVVAYPLSRPEDNRPDFFQRLETVTRSPAWALGHGTPVVSVDGYTGGIALTHIDPQAPAQEPVTEMCGKCKTPFDPADTRFDGRARYEETPYCRGCVDLCHDNEIADHRCVICA